NGHIPHTDSFYQNIKEYTSCHFTEIPGKVNQDGEIEAFFRKSRKAQIKRRNVAGILAWAFIRARGPIEGYDTRYEIHAPRRLQNRVEKAIVPDVRAIKPPDSQGASGGFTHDLVEIAL
ncbi:MAG TPA: hypothetical protein PKO22_10105, partial [Treponemataceae bacterium]|nr:hypothetical protein [Treponemataceae bacterium]